jgi:hypothetical protein
MADNRKGFIVNPYFDAVFFIFSPVWAFLVGYGVASSPTANAETKVWGHDGSVASIAMGTIIFAHLVLVFFRSHGNSTVFKRFPIRFTLAPILLFAACSSSSYILVCTSVLATWWDVYHSSLQTFGLGRIYDMRAGNKPDVGRRLDMSLNLLLYMGPILGGATLMNHVDDFNDFGMVEVRRVFFSRIPALVEPHTVALTVSVLMVGVPFLLYYVTEYYKLHRAGYKVSPQKVILYAITGLVSILAWGFNTFGEAFLIMNLFHAVQYFAIVWWSENENLSQSLGLGRLRWGRGITFLVVFGLAALYGFWAETVNTENEMLLSITLVVSIMHFWYDGFIWSVRKKHVPD